MATLTTTVKVDICSFSEYRMYPGRGTKFASRDGKVYFFLNSKTSALGHKKIKPIKLRWTQSWRRANKKLQSSTVQRRRARRTARFQKPIVGLSLEELKSRRLVTNTTSDRAIRDAKLKARKGKVTTPAPISPLQKNKKVSQPTKSNVLENQPKQKEVVKPVEQPKKVEVKKAEQPKQDIEIKKQEQKVEVKPVEQVKKVEQPKQEVEVKKQEQKPPVVEKAPEPPKKEEPKKSSFIGKLFGRR